MRNQIWLRPVALGIFAVALQATTAFAASGDLASFAGSNVDFQGRRWTARDGVDVRVREYRGVRALSVRGGDADDITYLNNVDFRAGHIEFDVAFPGRRPPWICFGIRSDGSSDRIQFNPTAEPGASRLQRAILTKNERNSLVLNFRQLRGGYDANAWLHVELEVSDGMCRVYLADDTSAALEIDNPFAPGPIGIQGDCFIRNLKIGS